MIIYRQVPRSSLYKLNFDLASLCGQERRGNVPKCKTHARACRAFVFAH